MKRLIESIVVILFSGLVLVSCQADKVAPKENNGPGLAGSAGDPHPALDVVCQLSDSFFMANEATGSLVVDRCFGFGGVSVPCPTGQMNWGYMIAAEGYIDNRNVVDFNFTMAPGWYVSTEQWKSDASGSSFQFDGGIPVITQDWALAPVNPVENRVQIRVEVGNLPTPTFECALKIVAVRLNLFGQVTPTSATNLWARNRNWNVEGSDAQSSSQWLMHFRPVRCLEVPPAEEVCRSLYVGNSNLNSCTTIAPINTSNFTGALTYAWNTGATTSTISVCPTATTTYNVTVSEDGRAVAVNNITVNVIDASCVHGNQNNQHKVNVCHLPPGNPENMQEICIDWSGVAAHVASYRPAGSTQGHDSGCEIGKCGSNPCL